MSYRWMTIFLFLWISQISIYGHLNHQDLEYIQNKGQWESQVLYKATLSDGAFFVEKDRFTFHLIKSPDRHQFSNQNQTLKGHAYQIVFKNANPNSVIKSSGVFPNYYNYFIGDDSTKWKGDCKAFEVITYFNIYPNIDLRLESYAGRPKYAFILKPGAHVEDIQLEYVGIDHLQLDPAGNLLSRLKIGYSTDLKPVSFIKSNAQKLDIPSSYVLNDNLISFNIADYRLEPDQVLEIDPEIIFSTFSGSLGDNFGTTATYDYLGNLYGAGMVFGVGYPITLGAYQSAFLGSSDIGITKFNQNGTSRIYSTYIGGSSYDIPHSLIVDQNNRLLMLASTSSTNYPTTTLGYDRTFNGGVPLTGIPSLQGLGIAYPNGADIAITKFNAAGNVLIGSTFFGGSGTDGIGVSGLVVNYGDGIRGEILVDSLDNVYIASTTTSVNIPTTTSSFQQNVSGLSDGLIAKFNTNLSNLLFCTYFGGTNDDAIYDISLDNNYNIVAVGGTMSSNLSTTSGAVNPSYSGNTDGFIVGFNNAMSTRLFASYYGTSDYDQIYFVELNDSNQINLFGQTSHAGSNYYLLNATFSNPNQGQFISVLNQNATSKIRSTTFGAGNQNPDISPTAFLVDYCNKIFITGWGSNLGVGSSQFALSVAGLPTTANAFQATTANNSGFYMMILEGDLSQLHYGTFFGGTTIQSREHVDGGTSRFDKNGIVYHAVCAGCGGQNNFPITPANVVGPTNGTIGTANPNCNLGVFKFDFGLPVKANFASNTDCAPGNIQFTNLSHTVGSNPTYQWNFGNGNTSNLKNPTNFYNNPGQYTVRLIVTDSTSCNFSDTVIKNVLVLGFSKDTLPDKFVCNGNSVRIGFTNVTDPNISIAWTPTATIDDPNILAPYASPNTTTLYRAIIIKGNCIDTFIQRVVVQTPFPLTINGPDSVCAGTNNSFFATKYTAGNYSWQPSNALISSNRDTAVFLISQNTSISVVYTSAGGCISSAIKNLKILNPQVKLSADTLACLDENLVFNVTTNVSNPTFQLSPSNLVLSNTGNNFNVKIDTTRFFKIKVSLGGLCEAQDSIRVTLVKDHFNWNIDSSICFNNQVTATVLNASAYNINWQPNLRLVSGQNTANAVFDLQNTDQFVKVQATLKSRPSCQFSDSAFVRYINNHIKIKGNPIQCKDSLVRLESFPFSNVNYSWTPSNKIVSQNREKVNFRADTSRFYFLTITDNSGCVVRDSFFAQVFNNLIQTKTDSFYCFGDTVDLQTTAIAKATYQWFPAVDIISGANQSLAKIRVKNTQWIYVQIIDSNACFVLDSVYVNLVDSSQLLTADFDNEIRCILSPILFTNKTLNQTAFTKYTWNFGDGTTSSQKNPTHTFANSGVYKIMLIAFDSLNCRILDSVEKDVLVLSNKKHLQDTLKSCQFETKNIGFQNIKDSTSQIVWSPTTELNISIDRFYPIINPSVSRTYQAIITKNGCQDTFIFPIKIGSKLPLKINGDATVCLQMQRGLSANKYDSGTYNWRPASNLVFENRDSVTFFITTNPTKIYLDYVSEFNCLSKDSLSLNIINNASLKLVSDSIFCKGDTINISHQYAPKGGSFLFIPNNLLIQNLNTTSKHRFDSTQNYVVQYTVNPRCRATDTLKTKILNDAVNLNAFPFLCNNQVAIANINTSNRWAFQWQPQQFLVSNQGSNPAQFDFKNNSNTIYIFSNLINRPQCASIDSIKIWYIKDYLKLVADTLKCKDSISRIFANRIPGFSYSWSPQNLLIQANDTSATFKTDTSRYFYLTLNDGKGCIYFDSVFVRIPQDLLKLSGDSTVCENEDAFINASAINGAQYIWSSEGTFVSANGGSSLVVKGANSFRNFLEVRLNIGCSIFDTFKVNVLNSNSFNISTTDTISCSRDTLGIKAIYLPLVTYNWQPQNVIIEGQGTDSISAFINKSTMFYVTARLLLKGCQVVDSIFIVKDTNSINLSANPIACLGDTVVIKANYNPNYQYVWSPTNWVENRDTLVKYILKAQTEYICKINLTGGFAKCSYSDTISIDHSRILDNLKLEVQPEKLEYGDTAQLFALGAPSAVSYEWSPRNSLSNFRVPNPLAFPDTTTRYSVTLKDIYGCKRTDTISLPVFYEFCGPPEIFVPSGFTPNLNAINDILFVRGNNIEAMYFAIYDRWGQKVFDTKNQKVGWDGTFKGKAMEPSVFSYYLDVKCIGGETYIGKGNITLIK